MLAESTLKHAPNTDDGLHGGPKRRLSWTWNVVDNVPVDVVDTRCLSEGGLQPMGMAWSKGAPTLTVGSPGVSLHSSTYPKELSARPVPDTVTTSPCTRLFATLGCIVPTPKAAALVKAAIPATTSAVATRVLRTTLVAWWGMVLVLTRYSRNWGHHGVWCTADTRGTPR